MSTDEPIHIIAEGYGCEDDKHNDDEVLQCTECGAGPLPGHCLVLCHECAGWFHNSCALARQARLGRLMRRHVASRAARCPVCDVRRRDEVRVESTTAQTEDEAHQVFNRGEHLVVRIRKSAIGRATILPITCARAGCGRAIRRAHGDSGGDEWATQFCESWYCGSCTLARLGNRLAAWIRNMKGQGSNVELCVLCNEGGRLITCVTCPASFHIDCAKIRGLNELDVEKWSCILCHASGTQHKLQEENEDDESDGPRECAFCRTSEDSYVDGSLLDEQNDIIGPWYDDRAGRDVWVHRRCALFSPRCYVQNGIMKNVVIEVQRARGLFCDVCRKSGASVGCMNRECKRSFHIECAERAECLIHYDRYALLCGPCYLLEFANVYPQVMSGRCAGVDSLWKHWRTMQARKKHHKELTEKTNRSRNDRLSILEMQQKTRNMEPIDMADSRIAFADAIGLSSIIEQLKEAILLPLLYPEVIEGLNIRTARGILLHGPPGTGKTLLARALAGECARLKGAQKVSFYARKGADLLSRYHGESERQLRELFALAYQNQPAIIFFDEIDALVPSRNSRQNQVHSSLVCTLLALMDGIDSLQNVFVLGATNRVDAVDAALRRPGRFDKVILIPLPSLEAKKEMIRVHTKSWTPRLLSWEVEAIADKCQYYSGADMKALCCEAMFCAIRENKSLFAETQHHLRDGSRTVGSMKRLRIDLSHFQRAFSLIVPSCMRRDNPHAYQGKPLTNYWASVLSNVLQSVQRSICPFAEARDGESFPDSGPMFTQPELHVLSPAPGRVLIHGPGHCGQNQLSDAILHWMDRLPIISIALPALRALADEALTPAQACVNAFKEATSCRPSVIYLPSIDVWWKETNGSDGLLLRAALLTCLNDLHQDRATTCTAPVIVVASSTVCWTMTNTFSLKIPPVLFRFFAANDFQLRPLSKQHLLGGVVNEFASQITQVATLRESLATDRELLSKLEMIDSRNLDVFMTYMRRIFDKRRGVQSSIHQIISDSIVLVASCGTIYGDSLSSISPCVARSS